MTLPASPPITMLEIITEYGGNGPVNLLAYVATNANVPATNGSGATIPSTAPLTMIEQLGATRSFQVVTFNTNGATGAGSNVVPTGATQACIEICGGGGGGSNCSNTSAPALMNFGPGGGAGYATINVAVVAGQTFSYVVGTGGLGGVATGAAGAIGVKTTLTRTGGLSMNANPGGGAAVSGSGTTQTTTVGAAGTANGSAGVLTDTATAADGTPSGRGGIITIAQTGRQLPVGQGGGNFTAAADGRDYGAGGGGASAFGGGVGRGGNGAPGAVYITYS